MICYVMICYVILFYDMLCHVIICRCSQLVSFSGYLIAYFSIVLCCYLPFRCHSYCWQSNSQCFTNGHRRDISQKKKLSSIACKYIPHGSLNNIISFPVPFLIPLLILFRIFSSRYLCYFLCYFSPKKELNPAVCQRYYNSKFHSLL